MIPIVGYLFRAIRNTFGVKTDFHVTHRSNYDSDIELGYSEAGTSISK